MYNHTADSYQGIYSLHKYWSKKPHNVVRDLIRKNSKKGDLILDSFCGSGISISEGLQLNRKAIGIDINPSSIFITRQLLSLVDLNILSQEFDSLRKNVKSEIDSLYKITRGEKKFTASHFIWNEKGVSEVWYKNESRYYSKEKPTQTDKAQALSFSYDNIKQPYPKEKLLQNGKINIGDNDKVHELYSPRNLKALAILFQSINKIENNEIRDLFKFCFTASLGQTSKMVFVINKKIDKESGQKIKLTKKSVGSWVIGFWKPKEHFEINVWNCFQQKFNTLRKAKENQSANSKDIIEHTSLEGILKEKEGFALFNKPAQSILKEFPENSIDFVITDPPHGDRIPYLELSQIWNSWLGMEVNYEDEIIISHSRSREKSKKNYQKLLSDTFSELYRVIKPNKKLTLMFNSLDDDTWIDLVETLNCAGFKLVDIETLSYSSNSVVQDNRARGLKKDFVLTYKKSLLKPKAIHLLNGADGHDLLMKGIRSAQAEGKKLEDFEILNELFYRFLRINKFFKMSQAIKMIDSMQEEPPCEKNL